MAATFVLVHGGGHGGWCWRRTARLLSAGGNEVYAPTLTGFGDRSHLDTSAVTFATFVQDIVNVFTFEDLRDVVLVGHSMGGVIIPRVAEELPDRIRRVVWLAAVVTNDGESLLHSFPPSPWIAKAVTIGPDGTAQTDPGLIVDAVVHDGTAEDKAFVRDRHLPYPPHALTEPGRLSAFLALGLPTGYLVAAEDRTIEPHVARMFAARLPGALVAEVPGGHDCMITRPIELTAALAAMAA
ncbi:MAG TPA: alpha/beta hydrolase [Acidimicrobiales bacterium]|nr:alpha/beta hydrolase [Acidimicrobiales bacterium]